MISRTLNSILRNPCVCYKRHSMIMSQRVAWIHTDSDKVHRFENRIDTKHSRLPSNDTNYLENMAAEDRVPGPASAPISKSFEERIRDGESGDWSRGAEDGSYRQH